MTDPGIAVIVPAYNCMDWLPFCLESIRMQYIDPPVPIRVCVVDDASPDPRQRVYIAEVCERYGWYPMLNEVNQQCPKNLWDAFELMNPDDDDIIVIVDGDDFLPHHLVFDTIHKTYVADPDCWLTYGNYRGFPEHHGGLPECRPYPPQVVRRRSFRTCGNNWYNHPITYKAFLWRGLNVFDLQWAPGEWFKQEYDTAIMVPLLEMAGDRHHVFDEVLYAYNASNPISIVHTERMTPDALVVLQGRPPKPMMIR